MISLRNLTKVYGDTPAVDGLSFDVTPGRVTGFLGPNGAGKSTTMRLILGLERPTAGAVYIDGRPYAALRRPLHLVGSLLDVKAFHPDRTAYQHLRCVALSNAIPVGRVLEVLEMVGLSEVAGQRARGFSLGMAQRLGIATALLGDPQVLMFDEPVNGLDPGGIHWARNFFQSLAQEGRTVFVSSHLMSEMALMADELIVIGRGRLIAHTDVQGFIASAGLGRVVVRSPHLERLAQVIKTAGGDCMPDPDGPGGVIVSGLSAPEVGDLAAHHGLTLHGLGVQEASLEAAFMTLTRDSVQFRADVPRPVVSSMGVTDA